MSDKHPTVKGRSDVTPDRFAKSGVQHGSAKRTRAEESADKYRLAVAELNTIREKEMDKALGGLPIRQPLAI